MLLLPAVAVLAVFQACSALYSQGTKLDPDVEEVGHLAHATQQSISDYAVHPLIGLQHHAGLYTEMQTL